MKYKAFFIMILASTLVACSSIQTGNRITELPDGTFRVNLERKPLIYNAMRKYNYLAAKHAKMKGCKRIRIIGNPDWGSGKIYQCSEHYGLFVDLVLKNSL